MKYLKIIKFRLTFLLYVLKEFFNIFLRLLSICFCEKKRALFPFIFPKINQEINRFFGGDVHLCEERQRHYDLLISRIKRRLFKEKDGQVKVVFLVHDQTFWAYDFLYEKLKENKYFDVEIVCLPFAPQKPNLRDDSDCVQRYQNTLNFFHNKKFNPKGLYGIEDDEWIPLKSFKADFLIYTICQGGFSEYEPQETGKYCLPLYIPYGIMAAANRSAFPFEKFQFNKEEHNFMYKVLLETPIHMKLKKQFCDLGDRNSVVVGNPKLDVYRHKNIQDPWLKHAKKEYKKRIIWAPHFTIDKIMNPSVFYLGAVFSTFDKNYIFFKNYIQQQKDILFCIKPHPNLVRALTSTGFMTKEKYDEYMADIMSFDNAFLFDGGSYVDYFIHSDAMITDSVSFLSEYLPSNKPLLFLENDWHAFNGFGKIVMQAYEKCPGDDFLSIKKFVEETVVKGADKNKQKRQNVLKETCLFPCKTASEAIENVIEEALNLKSSK